jgi:hypothetical protein
MVQGVFVTGVSEDTRKKCCREDQDGGWIRLGDNGAHEGATRCTSGGCEDTIGAKQLAGENAATESKG